MSDWRALFGSEAAAQRYLATITDPSRRASTAADLGLVDANGPATSETRPPAATSKTAYSLPSSPAMRTFESTRTTAAITLLLPFPPSMNSIWRSGIKHTAGKPEIRVRLSTRARMYRHAVAQACADQGHPTAPVGRLAVTIDVHAPDHRKRDLDNLNKALMDALTHARVWHDDSLIDELHLHRRANQPGGAIVMHVAALEPE
ncbi:RusA family crossover junction endodeoxyribonuclease [Deinococcus sp. ME38]|uniref:RusA family crossover junction endodeoxyribonuclease n=1 Tax=Deinococcus sp. ME38 TaxID=3400344 RepID=UPI003B5B19A7